MDPSGIKSMPRRFILAKGFAPGRASCNGDHGASGLGVAAHDVTGGGGAHDVTGGGGAHDAAGSGRAGGGTGSASSAVGQRCQSSAVGAAGVGAARFRGS